MNNFDKNDLIFISPVLKILKERNVWTNFVIFENPVIETAHSAIFYL